MPPGGTTPGGKAVPGLVFKVTPRLDDAPPIAYVVTGRLRPGDASASAARAARRPGCRGYVRVTARRGKRRVARRVARVRANCHYRTKVRVKRSKLAGHGSLKLKARFTGNGTQSARSSKAVKVRYRL